MRDAISAEYAGGVDHGRRRAVILPSHSMHLLRTVDASLHDLILGQASMLSTLHGVAISLVTVLDIGETKWPTTILVSSELG